MNQALYHWFENLCAIDIRWYLKSVDIALSFAPSVSMKKIIPTNIKIEFGRRVRQMRLEKGLSQEELALSSGLDRSYVGGIERGERNVSLINISKIAQALELSPGKLFEDRE